MPVEKVMRSIIIERLEIILNATQPRLSSLVLNTAAAAPIAGRDTP